MWVSYILASLNFVLYVHHQSDYVGCSNDTVMVATEDGPFFPVCIGGIPAQRTLRGTESLEPCSAYRKDPCLRCRFWQFSIFQISLWLSEKKVPRRSVQVLVLHKCCLNEWKAASSGTDQVAEGSQYCSPRPPGLALPLQRLVCTSSLCPKPGLNPDVPGRAFL